jgi:hypothetical protein
MVVTFIELHGFCENGNIWTIFAKILIFAETIFVSTP